LTFEDFELNLKLFEAVQSLRRPLLDAFFYYFAFLGSGWVLLVLLPLLYRFRRKKLKPLLTALLLETAAVVALKELLNQPRPPVLFKNLEPLFDLKWRSFPSGDAAMAFTIAVVLSEGERPLVKVLLYAYAFLIAFERVYAGVHFPLDVLAGALIGATIGKLTLLIYNKWGR